VDKDGNSFHHDNLRKMQNANPRDGDDESGKAVSNKVMLRLKKTKQD